MMTPDEMIEVIQAHKEGKKIEVMCKASPTGEWGVTPAPSWNFTQYSYRVKKEPLVLYARLAEQNGKPQVQSLSMDREVIEKSYALYGGRVVKLQEVEE